MTKFKARRQFAPYMAHIHFGNFALNLGYCETEEQAAMSYDQCCIYQVGCHEVVNSRKAIGVPYVFVANLIAHKFAYSKDCLSSSCAYLVLAVIAKSQLLFPNENH